MRRGTKPGKAKDKARRPAARTPLKNDGARVRDLGKRLAESLEQQAATAEILRIIGTSPIDTQPVFDGIARSGVTVCGADSCVLFVVDGDMLRVAATQGVPAERIERFRTQYPMPLSARNHVTQTLHERRIFHLANVEHNPAATPQDIDNARLGRYRTRLMVPMVRGDSAVGLIAVTRRAPAPFSDQQVALLQTFADQAVIAIENVRLFTEVQASNRELTTALDTQTATSDILRVISRSQTNVQPVFDAIVTSAVRLLRGYTGALTRVAGDQIELAAHKSTDEAAAGALRALFPRSLQSGGPAAQTVRDRAPVNIADQQTDPQVPEPVRAMARVSGHRSVVWVPLLHHDEAVGGIGVTRREPGGFTDDELALLKTFADQAVIAIENARLLSELQRKNEALTQAHAQVSEALEQQTATSEVLKVISRSTFDLQPVLDTLIENATRLCGATRGHIFRFDGEVLRFAASYGATPEFVEWLEQNPVLLGPGSVAGRAASERRTLHVHDVLVESGYEVLGLQRLQDYRTVLAVPMLREVTLLGVITILKTKVEPFTQRGIDLLATFADQAVIAIENVRLLQELQARTSALARSVEELKALGEVSRAVGSTLDLETVLNTIVTRAVQLSSAKGGVIYEYDEATQEFSRISAAHGLDDDLGDMLRASPLRLGEGAAGSAAVRQAPVQVADVLAEGTYGVARVRAIFERRGYRSLLAVPLLFERQIIGVLVVWGREPVGFAQEIVDLLQTLATQSVLAIQNARLFREIADKSAQLEAASRHKSEFLANMSHELRTPLNAIIGFSEILAEKMFGDINEKQTEYLRDILESGQHLLALINDILDLSKVEAGRMELELSEFDLPSALENALTLVRERASRRGITLGSTIDSRLGMIGGDERKVKQVLLNLLSNALKFTPEGGRIDVGARLDGDVAEVSVADTGVGIAPADQEAVFEEFRQVGAADKKAEGTGLGLALARKFIELHGGKIWVASQVGAGSTFTFTLPLQRSSAA